MTGEDGGLGADGGRRSKEPKILAFCCTWCSYAGADLAGVSRFQYPPDIRIIRVMCSGRMEPALMVRAIELGADGVLVMGCHPGDCHYIGGNLQAEKNFEKARKLLAMAGVEGERLRLEWVSAAEGKRFAEVVTEFTGTVKRLGPLNRE